MSNLFKVELGTGLKILGDLAGRITVREGERLKLYPEVWDDMVTAMRAHPAFQLRHGRFTPLADKLDLVRSWPGVQEDQIDAAQKEFASSERRRRYEAEMEKKPFLEVVATVYRASIPETLVYARDRYREAFDRDHFAQWEEAYGGEVDDNRGRLFKGVPDHRNCIRIEVVDLAANWNREDGFIPRDVRDSNSAAFAVIYAAAQSPAWVRQMDGEKVPYAFVGGLELNVPGYDEWMVVPRVWFSQGIDRARLRAHRCDDHFHGSSVPILWE